MEPSVAPELEPHAVAASGAGPFLTSRKFILPDGTRLHWRSRHHRKGLGRTMLLEIRQAARPVWHALWMPQKLNWWIGSIFALGATLFLLASLWSLFPGWPRMWGLTGQMVNATFFLGSIPFTTAAYLQLNQAANAGVLTREGVARFRRHYWIGWRPKDIGWWSCLLQFAGTLLFNINTFDALMPDRGWLRGDLVIWLPNVAGSILFLVSGWLAFAEQCHRFWKWDWNDLSWWVVFTNLVGCMAFMVSAGFSILLPTPLPFAMTTWALAFTGLGAVGFLAGSLLMLPEAWLETPNDSVFPP